MMELVEAFVMINTDNSTPGDQLWIERKEIFEERDANILFLVFDILLPRLIGLTHIRESVSSWISGWECVPRT